MSSEIVLPVCVSDDHDNASAQEGGQVSLLARVVLCHQVKRIVQKLKEEVTWTSNADLIN